MVYPSFYHGPVNYFTHLIRESTILLEQLDHYSKQTYRNRCVIVGANGVQSLSIPVKRQKGAKTLFKDIRIDYDTPWNKIHWRSLVACYASSPFFEYYQDELVHFYEGRTEFLVDLNLQLLKKTLDWLNVGIQVGFAESFTDLTEESDPRNFIHPKKNQAVMDPDFQPVAYHQVFSDRLGFQANLSILDLLFNEGPATLSILHQCFKT